MSKPLQMLIVEDDIVDRKLLERLLMQSSLGACDVRHADCLGKALELLDSRPSDVVLLDLGLPDSQGMNSVSRLQACVPHVPIIVLSGLDDEETATHAVQMGVQDYLIKGHVDANLLVRSIRYAMERKKAERQLQVAELRYRTIFENSAVAIMMVDAEERLISWNKFTEQLLRMGEEQLRGRAVKTFYPGEEWQKIRASSIRRKGMQHHLETRMICGDGKIIDVDISLSVVHDTEGGITGSIGVIRDITERKNTEEALCRHVAEIERFNRLATARELRVVELKRRVNELAAASGQSPPYPAIQEEGPSESEAESAETVQATCHADAGQQKEHTLADLLDRDRMQQLLDSYCDAMGISAGIVDLEGNVVVGARWQPICVDFHRANASTLSRCVESDTLLAGQLRDGEQFSLYECRNGLTDAASPVIIKGRHVANVFIGQFFLESPDREFFRRQAAEFGFDETKYLEALSRVPIIPREKLPAMIKYVTTSAQLLAETGLERIRAKAHQSDLLRWAEELNQANQALRQQREAAVSLAEDANEARAIAERVREALLIKDSGVNSAASGIVFFDVEGKLTFANPSALRMWGCEEERQVLGRSVETFVKSADEGLNAFRLAMEKGVWSGELIARRDDGSDFVAQISASIVKDKTERPICLMLSLVDVTENRRIHEILDRKQKNLEAIFDATPLGMLLVNDHLEVRRANDAVRQMSGKGYASLIDHDICETLSCMYVADLGEHPGTPSSCEGCLFRDAVQRAFASNTPVRGVETQVASSEDAEARPWFLLSVEPVDIDGSRYVLIALSDITGRKRAEEELKATLELKAQFISTVSHELRTPLSSMKEAVIIVLDGVAGKINKDQRHFLDIARRNIDRLSRLIDDVLDFQKLNAGKMKLNMQENSVAVTLSDVYNTMRPTADKVGVRLTVDVQPDLPPVVYDNDRILQVIINLVNNAIKFTPQGGQVRVLAERQQDYLAVHVSDTGYGIPKEDLPKVFDQFYRVHRPGKEIKGTGLGLAIVNGIVIAHKGRIEVESELDKGTTFTVFLPACPQDASATDMTVTDRDLETILRDK